MREKECYQKLRGPATWALLCGALLFFPSGGANGSTYDLRTPAHRLSFLGYLRRVVPTLYQDFVVRTEAMSYLETAQRASEALEFNLENVKRGHVLAVHRAPLAAPEASPEKLVAFRQEMANLGRDFPNAQSVSLIAALRAELAKAAQLEGIGAGVAQAVAALGFRGRADEVARYLTQFAELRGFDPRRIGIDKDALSGREVVELHQSAIQARDNSIRLIATALLSHRGRFSNLSVEAAAMTAARAELFHLRELLDPRTTQSFSEDLIGEVLSQPSPPILTKAKIHRLIKSSRALIESVTMAGAQVTAQPVLTIESAHPYVAWVRGSVGDCSTDNSYAISLCSAESINWLKRGPASAVKGYLQYTLVEIEGDLAIYLNTISGAGISREVTRQALSALAASMGKLGAKRIAIPVPEKFKDIINYPEVDAVFRELAARGRRVALKYIDASDRKRVAPFNEDQLDLPETNAFAIEIAVEDILDSSLKSEFSTQSSLQPQELFPRLSREEAIQVALDLKNNEQNAQENAKELELALEAHQIPIKIFEKAWNELGNPDRLNVESYHQRIEKLLALHGLKFDWEAFRKSLIFYRGHLRAPDALSGSNLGLLLSYLNIHLLSYSDLGYVYSSLTPHYSELVKTPDFIRLVRLIFRRNLREMDRLLDRYELESKSAYRVLISLVDSGMPLEPFREELKALDLQLENESKHADRAESVFFRRKTLLGLVESKAHHFRDIMARLERITPSTSKLDADDKFALASYFSRYALLPETPEADIKRIERFLVQSELGMSFLPWLGYFRIDRFNVPGLVQSLLAAKKIAWAAYLVQLDPWPKHPSAARWLSVFWQNRALIGDRVLLDGIVKTPSWLSVPGAEAVVDGLITTADQTPGSETILAKLLAKHPEKVRPAWQEWLNGVSAKACAAALTPREQTP